jgi:predicted transcriptional regulator
MKAEKRLFWWILIASSGGLNRARILKEIIKKPYNANELSKTLKLDYKTTRHHLDILQKNRLIISSNEEYNKVYFPSDMLENNIEIFNEIWAKIGKK